MRKIFYFLIIVLLISCGRDRNNTRVRIITVSIAPIKYFVEQIAGSDFQINIMVPVGADPHTYEPFPEQINRLRKSEAYISNGYLSFEMSWLDRFYQTNPRMKKLSLGDKIDLLVSSHQHEGGHEEGADPHYWMSPKCALIMASSIKELLCNLNSSQKQKYEINFQSLVLKIQALDEKAKEYFEGAEHKSFMIYHPNLGYLARDYGLEEIPVEFEGKEPPPSRIRELIDRARRDNLKIIFVQREYDTKNAKAIAGEIGAELKIIDPLSEEWQQSTMDIINSLHNSLK